MKLRLSTANITCEVAPLGTIISRVSKFLSPSFMKGGETNCHSVQSIWKFPRFFFFLNFSVFLLTNGLNLHVTNQRGYGNSIGACY
jgi:hypothetical protein